MTVFFYFERYKDQSQAIQFLHSSHKAVMISSMSPLPKSEMFFTHGNEEDIQAFRKVLKEHNIEHIESTTPQLNWDNPFTRGWINPAQKG